jgi:hypothetical protein
MTVAPAALAKRTVSSVEASSTTRISMGADSYRNDSALCTQAWMVAAAL